MVKFIVLCENSQLVNPGPDQKIIIFAPIIKQKIPFKPTLLSFGIVVGMDDLESGSDCNVTTIIKGVNGEELFRAEGPMAVPAEQKDPVLMLGIDVRNLKIEDVGVHSVELHVNGELASTQTFRVLTEEV